MLQSSENSSNCEHLIFSNPRSVDASTECTLPQQRFLLASNLPSDRNLGIQLPGSSVGVGWLAYSVMRFVSGDGYRRTRREALLQEKRLHLVGPVRGPTPRLLVLLHFAIHTYSCRALAELDLPIGFSSPSIALGPRSERGTPPLAYALQAVEHPTLESFSLGLGEIVRAFDRALQGDAPIAVCFALHSNINCFSPRSQACPYSRCTLSTSGNWGHLLLELYLHRLWGFLGLDFPLAALVAAALTSYSSFRKRIGWGFTLIGAESMLHASLLDDTACTGIGVGGPVEAWEWRTIVDGI